MSVANSSTVVKARQPNQQDVQFSRVLSQIRATRQAVEDAGDIGEWKNVLSDINAAALSNRLESTLEALARSNPRLSSILAMLPDIDQEEDQDARTRKDWQGRKVFKTMSMDDVDNLPDLEYRIEKIFQVATVSLLFGDSNVGKTFLALHLALCIAYDLPFFGRKVKPGPVLYIYAEGIRGLKPRSQAWRKHYNQPKTNNIQFIGFPVHLIEDRQTLLDTIGSIEEEQGIKFALIVIDTFSNCSSGINQNDQMEIQRVFASAHEIVRDYGCNVLVVHHTNNTGKFNGSAAFKNHVDTMVELKRVDNTSPIIMHSEKARDDDRFKDIILDLEVVDLGLNPTTLEPLTSCIVVASNAPTLGDRDQEQAEQEQKIMLAALKEHGPLSKRAWQTKSNEKDVPIRAFNKHIDKLVAQKKVVEQLAKKRGDSNLYMLPTSLEQSELITPETSANVSGVLSAIN